jgi:hypothetical protein
MPGLDPGIHPLHKILSKQMDHRVKPGDDAVAFLPARRAAFGKALADAQQEPVADVAVGL